MKKKITLAVLGLCFSLTTIAQNIRGISSPPHSFNNWTNFKPASAEYNTATHILSGIIDKDMTLSNKNTYLLVGVVYVKNASLTIEPGTVIRGDEKTCGTLVITRGAKILAEGLETNPIIFTSNKDGYSRKPGNWGGIILLGNAPINTISGMSFLDFNLNPAMCQYGGSNPEDNSGILKYVHIEYSGRKLNELKELNGLSMAGIGNKTILSHIQISYSNDDSFECYGGNVNLDNLISYRCTDDDFDFTQGAQGNISNSIAIRYPYSSDFSGSRSFEIDSYDKAENADFNKKMTQITANNITLINMENNEQGLVRESIFIKKDSQLNLTNSVISGFAPFILMDKNIEPYTANLSKISFSNVLINNCKGSFESEEPNYNSELNNWYSKNATVEFSQLTNTELFIDSGSKSRPDFRIQPNNSFANND
ncbi:hypothetical protein [Flavobacterium daejeonense]|uniref:hypothetical protein n=1 Tax=Flavobacterium daejeonense TaxID=350893 RepID=UPI00047DF063|nr:hypothetical protein [Flavobacterium daejeonense]